MSLERSGLIFFRFDEAASQPQGTTVDLTGHTISARVYLPSGVAGPPSARSGVMLFFQDIAWRWAQSPWLNIETTDEWITVSVRADDLPFDRTRVRAVGIKVGVNTANTNFSYAGPIFVDEVRAAPAIGFDFPRPHTRSEDEVADLAALRVSNAAGVRIQAVRWWLLADGRAGVLYDANGFVTGVEPELLADIREMLRLARSAGVYLMPVLFDFLLGAEPVVVDGVQTFGRADLINDPARRQSLLEHALTPIFEEFAASNEVLAIDLFNEPEWLLIDSPLVTIPPGKRPPEIRPGGIVTLETMREFFAEVIALHQQIRQPGRHPLVTVGSASARWVGVWSTLPLDMAQFHLWNAPGQIDEGLPLPPSPPVSGVPNILGEYTTVSVPGQSRCDLFVAGLRNGYAGSFPWAYRAKDTQSQLLLGAETRHCLASLPRFTFTDEPVVAGVTPVRAVHVRELRITMDSLRASCGLTPYPYVAPPPVAATSTILAAHFAEPRLALAEYFDCRSGVRPVYPNPQPAAQTPVLARHLMETRAAALAAP